MPRKRNLVPLPNFPSKNKFTCREEVDEYFSGEKIQCLLCGYLYKGLAPHLLQSHNMTDDEYRDMYDLPYKRGLVGTKTRFLHSESTKRRFQENKEQWLEHLDRAKAVQRENGNPQRKKPQFWKSERTKYDRNVYDEFVRRVMSGRGVQEVSFDEDMPTTANVYWYMKRDKDFNEKYKAIIPAIRPAGTRVQRSEG